MTVDLSSLALVWQEMNALLGLFIWAQNAPHHQSVRPNLDDIELGMTQITRAIALSLSQFSDRRFQRVVLKSIVLAIVALWALAAGGGSVLGWLFSGDLTLPWIGTLNFNGSLIGWGAFWIILGLSMFLMVPVAPPCPHFLSMMSPAPLKNATILIPKHSIVQNCLKRSEKALGLGTMLVANLIALIFYALFTVFAPIIFGH